MQGQSLATIEGFAPFGAWRTWYRVTGAIDGAKPPLVVLHGGPGCTHDYVDSLKELATTGRAVVHYDQIGGGRSTHLPDRGAAFWTVDLFIDELNNLLAHLGIADDFHLFGQSWGGMLGAEFAIRRPAGLRALVIADSPASMVTWVAEANRLRAALPQAVQAALTTHEAAGTTDSAEYEAAVAVFYARHLCRIDPMPTEVQRTFTMLAEDPLVYRTMNGPSEFHVVGSLKDWSVVDRVHDIVAPTLLISGKFDEATIACVQPFLEGISDVRWHIFGRSSHMPHVEEKDECLALVAAFLDRYPAVSL
ncbi:proline iminopeptidase-family hydrolase [Acidiphilium sp.]|uniref:proline iminopeptidase-family hydrolase n=1 Tax=Acidiphilium sp. TaxID=527 RepID=UPI003D08A756